MKKKNSVKHFKIQKFCKNKNEKRKHKCEKLNETIKMLEKS